MSRTMARTWKVRIDLFEADDLGQGGDVTKAHAVLTTSRASVETFPVSTPRSSSALAPPGTDASVATRRRPGSDCTSSAWQALCASRQSLQGALPPRLPRSIWMLICCTYAASS